MTDRELLEFAAKAEGRTWMSYSTGSGKGLCCRDTRFGGLIDYYWNPITDDGDALRLAVTLGINIEFNFADCVGVTLAAQTLQEIQEEPWKNDGFVATRRAIVKAAAEIGKEM